MAASPPAPPYTRLIAPLIAVLALPVFALPNDSSSFCASVLLQTLPLFMVCFCGTVPGLKGPAQHLLARLQAPFSCRTLLELACWLHLVFVVQLARLVPWSPLPAPLVTALVSGVVGAVVVWAGAVLTNLFETRSGSQPALRLLANPVVVCACGLVCCMNIPFVGLGEIAQCAVASLTLFALAASTQTRTPTTWVGKTVHDRIFNAAENWRMCASRSLFETIVWVVCIFGAHSVTSDFKLPRYASTLAGGVVALLIAAAVDAFRAPLSTPVEFPVNTDPTLTWREDRGVSKLVPLHPIPPSSRFGDKPLPRFKMAEVNAHATQDDCWIVLDGRVYDITKFIPNHPGGVGPVLKMAGKDATDAFANYHEARVYRTMLPAFLIGECEDVPVYPHVADFRAIRQELLRRGLFQTDYFFYFKHVCFLASLFISSVALSLNFVGGGSSAVRAVGAGLMGIFWQQLAGIGHDAGHSAISHNFKTDHLAGSLTTMLMGLSECWWKASHNTHHVICNSLEHDPDIQHMPLMAVTPKVWERGPFWSVWYRKVVQLDAAARALVSYQHIFFYPLMAVARFNLYAQGLIYLITKPDIAHHRKLELFGIVVFISWLTSIVVNLPSWPMRIAWMLVSHAVAGVLHIQIVLSHWSMETYHGIPYTNADNEWYLMQLRTTMNVVTPEGLDFVHIGLQHQIEHHLYPRLPRHNQRLARTLVRAVCRKHDIHYHEPHFFEGNIEMWKALKRAAMDARGSTKTDGGYFESKLCDGLNASG